MTPTPLKRFTIASLLIPLMFATMSARAEESPGFTMGNGGSNWIDVQGVTRQGSVLNFTEVQIEGNGWLVIHPFEDGAPNGDKYVASTYLKSGQ